VQSQADLDDVVRRAVELRVLCAQVRADAAVLKAETAVLVATTAATRQAALHARDTVRHAQAHRDAVIQTAQELKRKRDS